MIVAFELTMPGRGSWNGGWSGENSRYIKFMTLSKDKAESIKDKNYSYSWDDGWRANIKTYQVDSAEKRSLSKKSAGFCGYEWMINSIIANGEIRTE